MKNITLSMMVARTDVLWIRPMLEHLCNAHRNSVNKIVVFVDTAPLGPSFKSRPGVGTLEELDEILQETKNEGYFDEIRKIKYDSKSIKAIYHKHIGYDIGVTHDFRGYPIYGILQTLEEIDDDLVLHFDSDILFHQKPSTNWLVEAVSLLESREEVMFVAPHPGPPTDDGVLKQRGVEYTQHDAFFSFQKFSSRVFLFSKKKFQDLLPLEPLPISWKRLFWQKVSKKSAYLPWEAMVSHRLNNSKYIRADLSSKDYWTLHTPDHGPAFVKNLPKIIRKVESGWFPESQAGDYDMILEDWI